MSFQCLVKAPVKILGDRPDMTILIYWDVEQHKKKNTVFFAVSKSYHVFIKMLIYLNIHNIPFHVCTRDYKIHEENNPVLINVPISITPSIHSSYISYVLL